MGTRRQADSSIAMSIAHCWRCMMNGLPKSTPSICAPTMALRAGDGVREKSGRVGSPFRSTHHRPPTRHAAPRGIRERERAPPSPMRGVGAPSPAAGARSTAPTRRCPWGSVLDSGCADQRTEFSILGYMNIS